MLVILAASFVSFSQVMPWSLPVANGAKMFNGSVLLTGALTALKELNVRLPFFRAIIAL